MAGEKPDVLLVGAKKPVLMKGLESKVTLHHWLDAKDKDAFVKEVGNKIKAIAIAYTANKVDEKFSQAVSPSRAGFELWRRLRPYRRQVGRRARHRRHQYARGAERGSRRYRASACCCARCANFPSRSAFCVRENGHKDTIRSRRQRCATAPSAWSAWAASARRSRSAWRHSACRSFITAASRKRASSYKYYPKLIDMARDVDTLMVIVPGGAVDPEYDQCRGAQGAGAERHSH